ncbi:MAG: prepilin peptidase [Candidatus Buchananbacteria bacterium CG10_big_fil_rev_8_21_14_0_10_42_9]|uniref:Prepilin peptidase n=1 Tax=Candidatus Buchananbacteria bacterium CG10_big_fil_rev_8_21_14_0_10_42_9 TaxID=1974526 RepID=A0A2H0W0Y8_9BACT|nr:MAG: prepilin peptidase [Candidatus Buchananbacteria bacterium CG10_big_fil_rev_8_21_14_0_10_42_9]
MPDLEPFFRNFELQLLILFVLGTFVGSFLNVVIIRMHQGRSFLWSRSACLECKQPIKWYDNIPLLSFIILQGKCRSCSQPISKQYFLVELVTGLIFIIGLWQLGLTLKLLAFLLFACFLVVIFVYDLRWYLILDKVSLPAAVIALLFNLYLGHPWQSLLLGGAIGSGFFLIQFIVSKGVWIGGGDIRLGLAAGFMLGWKSLLVALFLAYLSGSIFGLTLIAIKKKSMQSKLPFGTFLAAATIVALLWGEQIINWYLNIF